MRARIPILAGVAAVTVGGIAVTLVAQSGSIVGSKHDFSAFGWSEGQICLPCHTPHKAMDVDAPLWNHELTQATYTLYDGSSAPYDEALDTSSILCMSCHDGTVALDSFGGKSGSVFMDGDALVGVNLRDDHPVGKTGVYPVSGSWGFRPADSWQGQGMYLRDLEVDGSPEKVVSCSTCHNPHNSQHGYMLRRSNAGSNLCLTCHIK